MSGNAPIGSGGLIEFFIIIVIALWECVKFPFEYLYSKIDKYRKQA